MSVSWSVAGVRLTVVNWRDPWHPAAGGAERYAWEIARRLAAKGARVHYVTGRSPGRPRRERVDGVEFVRLGGRFTVYPLVLLWMVIRRRAFDAVIDCQNGIPFFTPWVLPRRVPVFCVVHHVHTEQFMLYFPTWAARLGRLLEGPVARWTYRRHACLVVSPSTLRALRERLGWRIPAYVVPNGSAVTAVVTAEDAAGSGAGSGAGPDAEAGWAGDRTPALAPELVCVSRLVPHKRVEQVVELAGRLRDRRPALRVSIIGAGPGRPALSAMISARGLGDVITLYGYVSEETKADLVAGADLHLSTSRGEGWGLSVIEAAALGVPTVAHDVDGLRDAVRDGITGWLVRDGEDPADVVERAIKELTDPVRRREISLNCRRWAAEFDWAWTASRVQALVAAAVQTGSAHSGDDRAHVVQRHGDRRPQVVEGPVRDLLLADRRTVLQVRPATDLERLLGRVGEEAW